MNVLNGFYDSRKYSQIRLVVTDFIQKAEAIILAYETNSTEENFNLASYTQALVFIGLSIVSDINHFIRDQSKAVELFDKAIAFGHTGAMYNRACMHHNGNGGPIDYTKAIELFDKAIALGHTDAMYSRACMHHSGNGSPIDYTKAIELFDKAIALGHTGAMSNRAFMHENGNGSPIDYTKAIELYDKAIALGHAGAMSNRAFMHKNGNGGPIDYVQAIALLEKAINLGNSEAVRNRALINDVRVLNKQHACNLLDLIWKNLPRKQASLSNQSIILFQRHAQNEVFKKLTSSGFSVNNIFTLLSIPAHPINRIFHTAPKYQADLLKHAAQVQNERTIVIALFFCKYSRFSKLCPETIMHLLQIAHGYDAYHEILSYESKTDKTPQTPPEIIIRQFPLYGQNINMLGTTKPATKINQRELSITPVSNVASIAADSNIHSQSSGNYVESHGQIEGNQHMITEANNSGDTSLLSFFFHYPCTTVVMSLIAICILSFAIINGMPVLGVLAASSVGLLFHNRTRSPNNQAETQAQFVM